MVIFLNEKKKIKNSILAYQFEPTADKPHACQYMGFTICHTFLFPFLYYNNSKVRGANINRNLLYQTAHLTHSNISKTFTLF